MAAERSSKSPASGASRFGETSDFVGAVIGVVDERAAEQTGICGCSHMSVGRGDVRVHDGEMAMGQVARVSGGRNKM